MAPAHPAGKVRVPGHWVFQRPEHSDRQGAHDVEVDVVRLGSEPRPTGMMRTVGPVLLKFAVPA